MARRAFLSGPHGALLSPQPLSRLRFEKRVDLVFEPRDRILAEFNVLREFSRPLETAKMHARPRDAAGFQIGESEEPPAGTLTGNFRTSRHVEPRTLMSREVIEGVSYWLSLE